MNRGGVSLVAGLVVLALAGSSTLTYAAPAQKSSADVMTLTPLATASDTFANDIGFSKNQSKVYTFNLKGKWGMKFDVNQPETSPSGLNDIDAGAFYKLTPSLRVGGTVGFGEKSDPLKPEPNNQLQNKKQPRVRLETTFKF